MRKISLSFLTFFMVLTLSVFPIFATNDIPYYKVVKKEKINLYGAPVSIEIKHIQNVKDKTVQKQINDMINEYFKETVKKQSEELKESQPNNYIEISIGVSDYYNSPLLTSFSLDFFESMADSYEAKQYHTIDLKTGKEITIDHWIKKDFAKIIKTEVLKQINKQNQESGNEIYFMNEVNNLNITKDQSYYINKDGQVVVTFPKNSIAPAYVGLPEFIMPYNVKEIQ